MPTQDLSEGAEDADVQAAPFGATVRPEAADAVPPIRRSDEGVPLRDGMDSATGDGRDLRPPEPLRIASGWMQDPGVGREAPGAVEVTEPNDVPRRGPSQAAAATSSSTCTRSVHIGPSWTTRAAQYGTPSPRPEQLG